ncbi:MAG TPA: tetratricopeptide repeat protein [Candidatus Acidoferrum sp.]|nr:tetratricopeptide repeat protein [Candidatus Acidoferrum sp.]
MTRTWKALIEAGAITGLLLCGSGYAAAQGYGKGSQSQPPAQQGDKSKTPEVTPLTLDAPPPVSAEEEAAYKAFQDVPPADANKKIEVGEAFLQKYPQSRYRSPVYGALTFASVQIGQVQKMQEYGEKEIEMSPNDVSTLALLGQTLPRTWRPNTPDSEKILAKAEKYSKQAIEITPTLPKPAGLTDEAFASAKNQTLAMAHSGLGLVYVRRGKSAEAIPELEQAVKIDPTPDPVNYYLLGMANKSTSHWDDAAAAFTHCGGMPGPMQGTCKAQAEDAKKQGATQLSAPK